MNLAKRNCCSVGWRFGFPTLCAVGLLSLASATYGSSYATATDSAATGVGCGDPASSGGPGFTLAGVGPIPCAYASIGSLVSASGSWITGDFAASAVASANPVTGFVPSTPAVIGATFFSAAGTISLPSGMTSATITFGATGLSGTVGGLGDPGFFSAGDIITLDMIAGGTGGSRGSSTACLTLNLFHSTCPGGGFGLGLGPGALGPITLTVFDGEHLQLTQRSMQWLPRRHPTLQLGRAPRSRSIRFT